MLIADQPVLLFSIKGLPVGIGGQTGHLRLVFPGISRQLGIERPAQQIHGSVEQGPYRVRVRQQAALVDNGRPFRLERGVS